MEAAISIFKYHVSLILELHAKYLTKARQEQAKIMWEAGADGFFSEASVEACAMNDTELRNHTVDAFVYPGFREHTRAVL